MASPAWIDTTETPITTGTTSHTVTMPSGIVAGQHLVLASGFDGGGGTITGPAGWQAVKSLDINSQKKMRVWIKETDGTEASTVTVTSGNMNVSAHHILRFSGVRTGVTEGTTWDVASTSSGYGTIINPPSVTASWGSADQTVVALAYAAGAGPTVTTFPSSYSNTNDAASRAMIASCTRAVTAASEDPGTFTISSSNFHRGITLILRDAAVVVAGAEAAEATAAASDATADPPTTNVSAEAATATAQALWAQVGSVGVASDLVLEWDFDGDGDFDETIEDITDDVLVGSCVRGRSYASQITGRSVPGTMYLMVRNDDDKYNFFNSSSPANTDPYSLKGGRLIRLRTTESTPTDPVELARDSFGGNGPLATLDTLETWTDRIGSWSENSGEAVADGPPDTSSGQTDAATFPVGQDSYFAQIIIPRKDAINQVGLIFDWTDSNNYNTLYLGDGTIQFWENDAGSAAELTSAGAENRDDVALGLAHHSDGSLIAYLDGQQVLSTTSNITTTGTLGIYGKWFYQRPPAISELRVWDRSRIIQSWDTSVDQTGVLATMRVTKVVPSTDRAGRKVAEITARGPLRALERPVNPPQSTGPDDVQSAGVKSGQMIGNILHQVGLLQPPSRIDEGDLALGSVGFDRQRGLEMVRVVEETEAGFLWETADGGISFDKRSARDGTSVVATWTDDPLVPGFAFEAPKLRDWEGDVINRVRSEVSPSLPRQITDTDFNVTNTGTRNDVAITIPAEGTGDTEAAVNDLYVVVFSSTVQSDGQFWLTPPGWTNLRQLTDENGIRMYATRLRPGDFGDTVTFYDDDDLAGGGWVSLGILVKNWYGVIESGVTVSEFAGHGTGTTEARAGDNDPPVMFTPWPIGPTLFMPIRAGMTAPSADAQQQSASDDIAPDGFDSLGSHQVDGVSNADDCGIQWARRIRTEAVQNPGPFGGQFQNYDLVETCVLAVRGFAGDPPPSSGGDPVISNNVESQLDRGAVLSHPHPGRLFEDRAAALAYNDLMLTRFDQDRPIISVSFTATRDERTRTMCLERDLSDRVRIDADGTAGIGVDAEFFVESITDTFSDGATHWVRSFECSPATDSGGGAD